MGKTLLVSLVSDQTIPNVQLIKQLKDQVTDYFFVTTKGMENKGSRQWIENACGISGDMIEVEQFSFSDMEQKLSDYDFEDYDRIIVNLTGGTKTMTLVAYDFFKNIGAEIYYVTGVNNEYIKIFPVKRNNVSTFSNSATLEEYLTAYGFSINSSPLSGISFEQSEKIFKAYCTINIMDYADAIRLLNSKRGKTLKDDDYNKISDFLNVIEYVPINAGYLSKEETKYLSGDWFEEYVGLKIKKELGLSDNDIFISTELEKSLSQKVKNDALTLLGEVSEAEPNNKNEMDVMFMYNNKFYSIECKSSIIAFKTIQRNGMLVEKPYNILGETIYKSDSLARRFGLFANTAIFTLTDFVEYCKDDDSGMHKNKVREMEGIVNRANLSNIKLIDKKMLVSTSSFFDLIKN